MKKYVLSISLVLLAGSNAFAGGYFCRQCPAENDKCIPICAEKSCTNNENALLKVLTPKLDTEAAACCSWGPIPGCMKGC
ncbi:hypothetical protein [Bdellovibrio sp. HCB337]|uniref:hypothetical protein n=1 Tax=Bdellovibrio sp. HCB337 TaxID=3394358 RepID=UPI0039A4A3DC